jgi:penicillin-binding protein 1A
VVERDDEARTIGVQVGDTRGVVHLANEERFNPQHLLPSEFVGDRAALRVRVIDDPDEATDDEPVRLRLELGPQAALVALDPKTRQVLAAVGNYEAQAGGLDRTVQTKRQPGSTFKPLVYSYALNTHQITAATQFEFPLSDKERKRAEEEAKKKSTESDADEPAEVADTIKMSLRRGVATSDNRVARKVFRIVGARQAVQWAQAMGIRSKLGADESLMLGSYEMTVTEMAGAFSVFASGGTALEPQFVTAIESGAGPVELPAREPERRVMDPEVAFLTTSILSSVVEEGTGKRARSLGRPLAGKTGTTNRAKDAWFIGYSTDLVVAVWVGYDDALPLGWGESGAASALPIWMSLMKSAHEGKPATQFPRPQAIEEAKIDPETGLLGRYGDESVVTEIFLPGTQPKETSPEKDDSEDSDEQDSDEDEDADATLDGPAPEPPAPPAPSPPPPGPAEPPPPPF